MKSSQILQHFCVKYEQMKTEQGRKEVCGDSSADVCQDDDAVVDGESRAKLEQLVRRLQSEVKVVQSYCFRLTPRLSRPYKAGLSVHPQKVCLIQMKCSR